MKKIIMLAMVLVGLVMGGCGSGGDSTQEPRRADPHHGPMDRPPVMDNNSTTALAVYGPMIRPTFNNNSTVEVAQ